MAALKSLQPAISALTRNPIIVVLVGLYGLVQVPQFALQSSAPLLATIVSLAMTGILIFVMPFLQGGLLGMADEALRGRTGWGTFVAEGKSNYVSLFLAYIILFAINFALGIAAFFMLILGGLSLFGGEGSSNLAAVGVIAVIGLLLVLVYVIVAFVVQFYAHAIVLSDTGLIDGFKKSGGLVRRNLLRVLGYSFILFVGALVLGGIGGLASLLLSPQLTAPLGSTSSVLLSVGAAVAYVLTTALLGGFYVTYSVAFYRSIEGRVSAV